MRFHAPYGDHVVVGLREQALRVEPRQIVEILFLGLFLLLEFFFLGLIVIDDRFGNQRVRVIPCAGEHAHQTVIIFGRDGIVLMVVAARAAYRKAQERLGGGVDFVIPFIGALDDGRIRIEGPDAQPIHAQTGDHLRTDLLVHLVGGDLRFHKLIVGHVLIHRVDDPVAIDVGVLVLLHVKRLVADVVVIFGVAHYVEPMSAPGFTVVWGSKQTIDHGLVCFGRFVSFEGLYFFLGGR